MFRIAMASVIRFRETHAKAAAPVDGHIGNSVMPQFGGPLAEHYGCRCWFCESLVRSPMRSIAFLTQKGGAGKTTLTASLAVAAAAAGEKVIALDLDSQGSLVRWSERRKAANAPSRVVIEPLESERLPQLPAILEGLASVGFTLAVFDTADADAEAVRLVIDSVDFFSLSAKPLSCSISAHRLPAACVPTRRRRC
jgi:CobQ/CobB/MinD/ParA family nucleotide binding protein